jgi:DNA-binding transcriptional LysR family regulator
LRTPGEEPAALTNPPRPGTGVQFAQLEAFLEVAREGNIGRAAPRIFVSQPALSARIQSLEAELGVELFNRTSKGMHLTSVGQAFLPFAARALDAVRQGSKLVAGMQAGTDGEMTIGAALGVSTYVLPQVLARFAERRPRVRLNVRTGRTSEIVELVFWGEVDLGITRQTDDPRVATQILYEEDLVLVASANHPMARHRSAPSIDFSDTRVILFDRGSVYYAEAKSLLYEAGVLGTTVMELDNIASAKRMVEAGLGVSLLPSTAVADALETGALIRIEWAPAASLGRSIVLVSRRDRGPRTPAEAMLCDLLTHIPEMIAGAHAPGRLRGA